MLNDDFIESLRLKLEARPICAAALPAGREHLVASVFSAVLSRMGGRQTQAPSFDDYLNRRVHLDEDFHVPPSLRRRAALCQGGDDKWRKPEAALDARIEFCGGVLQTLSSQHAQAA